MTGQAGVERYAYILRDVADRVGLPSLKQVASRPGLRAAYRVIVQYADFSASDTVATLTRVGAADAILETVYRGHFDHRPIVRRLPLTDYERFVAALQDVHFDRLADQDAIPLSAGQLCMVERAAGSYMKGVIFAPRIADGVYLSVYNAVRAYLPEAFRELT